MHSLARWPSFAEIPSSKEYLLPSEQPPSDPRPDILPALRLCLWTFRAELARGKRVSACDYELSELSLQEGARERL